MTSGDRLQSFMQWQDPKTATSQPRRVWVDVGAHRGEYTFHQAASDPGLIVYAFEPNLEVIRDRIGTLANYVVLPYAVSETDATAPFYINSLSYSSSLQHLNPERTDRAGYLELPTGARLREVEERAVPTMRLDTFFRLLGVGRVELLKVDAQGHDLAVLRSAGDFLRDIDNIIVEASVTEAHQYADTPTEQEIVGFLGSHGFALRAAEAQTAGEEENLLFARDESIDYAEHDVAAGALPLVSVVVPTRNMAGSIRRTIDSVLSQDYPNIECIVVDGDSSDGTCEILESYGERIRWISLPDRGPFDAINTGWQMSSGSIIAWLNADDVYEPHAIRRAAGFLEANPWTAIVHGSCGLLDGDGKLKWVMPTPEWDLRTALEFCDHIIYQPTTFMRRDAIERAGWLYPAWTHDHELWIRVSLTGGEIRGIPFHLASARVDQPENYKGLPARYGPAKVELTKRIFDLPGLPANLRPLRRRALSNSYARGIDYLHIRYPSHWIFGARSFALAVITDPDNLAFIMRDLGRRLEWRATPLAYLGRALRWVAPAVRAVPTLLTVAVAFGLWRQTRRLQDRARAAR